LPNVVIGLIVDSMGQMITSLAHTGLFAAEDTLADEKSVLWDS